MTSSELKELVKRHFNLVDAEVTAEKFGELKDVNGAFTLKFPGDSLQVGDKVTVVTTEGQEMDAPNGEHELEDGTKIVTEDSVVKEIIGAGGEKALAKEEMQAEEEVAAVVEEVVSEVVEEVVSDVVEETVAEAGIEEVIAEIAKAMEEEMGKVKTKMAELEEKVAQLLDVPAVEPTIVRPEMSSDKAKFSAFNVDSAANAERIKLELAALKARKRK